MTQNIILSASKDERTAARSATARVHARKMTLLLFCLCLMATWQDRRLGPPLHDGMQVIAGMAIDYVEGSEALSGALDTAQKSYARLSEGG